MLKKIMLRNVIAVTVALLLFSFGSILLVSYSNAQIAKTNLLNVTNLLKTTDLGNKEQLERLDKAVSDVRVTIVGLDGVVSYDSFDIEMDVNHSDRPEIRAAIANKPQVFKRYSASLGYDMLYYAVKVVDNGTTYILRCAERDMNIWAYTLSILPLMVLCFLLSIGINIYLTKGLSSNITKPFNMVRDNLRLVNKGKYSKIQPHYADSAFAEVIGEINEVAFSIDKSIRKQQSDTNKLDYVINNIKQGVVAIDQSDNVAMINLTANNLFGTTSAIIGKNIAYLISDGTLLEKLLKLLADRATAVFEYSLGGKIWSVSISKMNADSAPPLSESSTIGGGNMLANGNNNLANGDNIEDSNSRVLEQLSGTISRSAEQEIKCIMIFTDITEKKNAEKLRSEFFANASHELKTPLTSIQGFSELLLSSLREEDPNYHYAEKINKDTRRINVLVEDMLKLSRLEGGCREDVIGSVSLDKVAAEVVSDLSSLAKVKNITTTILHYGAEVTAATSSDFIIQANEPRIYELINNLVSNAIRYNVEGGKITINLTVDHNKTRLVVSDTGIGIETKYQSRLFERFFMVDKARSKDNGGTGLGLAIVKHIANLYSAEIKLLSAKGEGTTITISFPKK